MRRGRHRINHDRRLLSLKLVDGTDTRARQSLLKLKDLRVVGGDDHDVFYGTGGRYEELADAKVRHFDLRGRLLTVSGKTGSRHIILQPSAVRLLKRVTKGRSLDDFIFVKADGSKWKPSDQVRPMKAAVRKAKLDLNGCFYSLRHAYISESIEMNVPLTVIAENCGTSVRMIEITYAKVLMEKKRKFVERGGPRLH